MPTKTVRKGLLGLEDVSQGVSTFNRTTSVGGSQTLNQIPIYKGAGSPEGSITAGVGSIFHRTDGGSGTALYVKESGAGNTGWTAANFSNAGLVPDSRTISTTSPLSGGGDLSANRTIAFSNQSANVVLAGPTSGGASAPAFRALVSADFPRTIAIPFLIDGAGSAITPGVRGDLEVPFACTVTGWTLLADQSGSIVIDVWKDTYANFPPTVADTIAGSEKPTLSAVAKNQDLSLSTWTTAISAGDTLRFNVDSVSTVTRVTLSIRATIP